MIKSFVAYLCQVFFFRLTKIPIEILAECEFWDYILSQNKVTYNHDYISKSVFFTVLNFNDVVRQLSLFS